MPKISVIIPCYNVEQYLDRCMKSVINQTLKDIEIILVDDGSLDKCPQICDEYAKKDSRIKVIHKQNAGLGFARNSGLEIATGEYVAFVDSDDYVDLSMYADLYHEAMASNADVVFCGFKTETQKGIWKDSNEVTKRMEWSNESVKDFMLDMVACAPCVKKERKYQMSVWHSIYRHDVIKKHNLRFHSEREVVSEDIPFQVDFLKRTNRVVYLSDSFYFYCLNGSSLTVTYSPKKFYGFKALRRLLKIQLENIDGSEDRINRLFIGYVRTNLMTLISSDRDDKDIILNNIISDRVWAELRCCYPASNLPLYARIIYVLTCTNHKDILKVFVRLMNTIRRTKCRRL